MTDRQNKPLEESIDVKEIVSDYNSEYDPKDTPISSSRKKQTFNFLEQSKYIPQVHEQRATQRDESDQEQDVVSVVNISIQEPSFIQTGSIQIKVRDSESSIVYNNAPVVSNIRLFKKAVGILMYQTIKKEFTLKTNFENGYFFGLIDSTLKISIFRLYCFLASFFLLGVLSFFSVLSYDGTGYKVYITVLFPVLGITYTAQNFVEFKLQKPYLTYSKKEQLTLIFDFGKYFFFLISVLKSSGLYGLILSVAALAEKILVFHSIKMKEAYYSYFCGPTAIVFDVIFVLISLGSIKFLSWSLILGGLSISGLCGIGIFLYKKKLSSKDMIEAFRRLDKILFGLLLLFIIDLMVLSFFIQKFEESSEYKRLILFFTSIAVLIITCSGIYLNKYYKPRTKIVSIQKRMIEPSFNDFRLATEEDNFIVDIRKYCRMVRRDQEMNIVYPQGLKKIDAAECDGCHQRALFDIYHVPGPCLHNIYCLNCAVMIMEKIGNCLICNSRVIELYRIKADFKEDKLHILNKLYRKGAKNI